MTLIDNFNLRASDVLRNRIAAACWNAAEQVRNEDAATDNHTDRLAWARRVFTDPGDGPEVLRVFRAVLMNPTVQSAGEAATDEDIQSAVTGLVDLFATGS